MFAQAGTVSLMGALDGYRVLDLSILIQGPQAAAMLHDMGADVIKIELPELGDLARWLTNSVEDGRSPYFISSNRGKRSVTLDLREPGGKRALEHLVTTADVLIHNFVPGTIEEWGLSYESLSSINPGLIFASGSTFGPLGPDAHREGADMVGQAAGGLMSTTGSDGEDPTIVGAMIADHCGCQNMIAGILAALLHRERTGEGQRIEVSLLGGQIWAQASEYMYALMTGKNTGRVNKGHSVLRGLVRTVATSDGYMQFIGAPPHQWEDFCEALDRKDLAKDPRYATLVPAAEDLEFLKGMLDEEIPKRTTAEWEKRFLAKGIRFSPVRNHLEVLADPGAHENGYFVDAEDADGKKVTVVGNPIRMSATPTVVSAVVPELGQHTEEVLLESGLGWDEIEAMRSDGAY